MAGKKHRLQPKPVTRGSPGDDQGLPNATVDSERVEELVDEGATRSRPGVVCGVENAKDPSVYDVTTSQFPEDDVSEEYLNQDN
jgi:hypothetical protein